MRRSAWVPLLAAVLWLEFATGCAQITAGMQPAPLHRDILAKDTDRTQVIGVLGAPLSADEVRSDEVLIETYRYRDGGKRNSIWAKSVRILLYTAGDFFTLFLSQVIWMPLEMAFAPTDYAADIYYENSENRWVVRAFREVDGETGEVIREHAPELWARLDEAAEPEETAEVGHEGERAARGPPAERLRTLEALREEGLIDEADYEARREAILDGI